MERGMRINNHGYKGTIVEITDYIPTGPFLGQPGALMYWDYINEDQQYTNELTQEITENTNFADNLQWVPWSNLSTKIGN